MSDRPTPETDAFSVSFKSIDDQAGKKKWVPADFASRLERERDEAREALMKIEDLFIDCTDVIACRENMGMIAKTALQGIK